MEYKLLAADMDGTALSDSKELGPRTVEAMERAIAKFGVKLSNKIWDYLYDIGKYCFLKAHSISYAFMSYQTACLKTNYRKEFDEIFSREK